MSQNINAKVLVLGGGPGGYVAAIRAGQLGLDTVLVDAGGLGGTCLLRGCIPSKSLIHAASEYETIADSTRHQQIGIHVAGKPTLDFAQMLSWKDSVVTRLNTGVGALLKRAGVKVISGHGRFTDAKTLHVEGPEGARVIHAEHVILATGSVPVELPVLPYGDKVISSDHVFSLSELPRRLVIVGAGYIGLELGSAFAKLGVEVSIVEAQDGILPAYDRKLVEPVRRWLERRGVKLHLQTAALGANDEGLRIKTAAGEEVTLPADRILVTVGRKPATEGWGLENTAVAMAGRFVKVDEQCATSTRGVWAIGDLVGEPMLAHKASAQGALVAEIISGQRRRFAPVAIPAICFTEPEIVTVGLGPQDTGDLDVITGMVPLAANGRALSMDAGDDGGFVRVIARRDDHRILGIQAVGRHMSELAGGFVQTLEMGAVLEDVEGSVYAHPTLGECLHEACLKALGHAIHA